MARFYSVAKISDRISKTPEGFLVCAAVPITRAGDLLYSPSETPVTPNGPVTVITRTVDDIHNPDTIASYEGKPITINHPDDFVTPENWRELAVGVVQNVRPGEGEDADKLLADLLITDSEAIYAIENKKLREVSCGFEAEYIETAPGRGRQEHIIGNHVALVNSGRCGSECAIFDHAPQERSRTMKAKIMALFGRALDEAMPEPTDQAPPPADIAATLAKIMERLDALESAGKPAAEEVAQVAEPVAEQGPAPAEQPAANVAEELAIIKAALVKLLGIEQQEVLSEGVDKCGTTDADTLSRAEILAPGIVKTGDVKARALRAAYETTDGKAVIDRLLNGKAFDAADKDMLFVSASELLKEARKQQISATRVTADAAALANSGPMTAEKINALNATHYGTH